jgi:hypothetical protein
LALEEHLELEHLWAKEYLVQEIFLSSEEEHSSSLFSFASSVLAEQIYQHAL